MQPGALSFRKRQKPEQGIADRLKKYERAISLLRQEDRIEQIERSPSDHKARFYAMIDAKLEEAAEGSAEQKALTFWKTAREVEDWDGSINVNFKRDFIGWLQGKGRNEDHERTPWGRDPAMMDLPDVRWWLESFITEKIWIQKTLLRLAMRTPQSLNEAYIYYKYIVNDGWKNDDSLIFRDFNDFLGGDGPFGVKEPGYIHDGTKDGTDIYHDGKVPPRMGVARGIAGAYDDLGDPYHDNFETMADRMAGTLDEGDMAEREKAYIDNALERMKQRLDDLGAEYNEELFNDLTDLAGARAYMDELIQEHQMKLLQQQIQQQQQQQDQLIHSAQQQLDAQKHTAEILDGMAEIGKDMAGKFDVLLKFLSSFGAGLMALGIDMPSMDLEEDFDLTTSVLGHEFAPQGFTKTPAPKSTPPKQVPKQSPPKKDPVVEQTVDEASTLAENHDDNFKAAVRDVLQHKELQKEVDKAGATGYAREAMRQNQKKLVQTQWEIFKAHHEVTLNESADKSALNTLTNYFTGNYDDSGESDGE